MSIKLESANKRSGEEKNITTKMNHAEKSIGNKKDKKFLGINFNKLLILICLVAWVTGLKAENLIPTVTKLNEWLEYGEGKTLVVSRSFVSPPFGVNGEPIYRTTEERDKYYIDLGIWQETKFKEYDIKKISWVHEKFPSYLGPLVASSCRTYVELMPVDLKALLPANLVEQKLPKNSRILLKGLTAENIEVPLIFEIEIGKNRIINIAFSLNMDIDIEKKVIGTILGYIKRTGIILPVIDCKAQTGFQLYEGTAWEAKGIESDTKLFGGWYDHQDPYLSPEHVKELNSILFWSFFLRKGKMTFVGLNFSGIPINRVATTLWNTMVDMDIIKPGGMCMINRDGTTQSASYYCNINTLVQTCSYRTSQWLLESLDGQNYDHTDIFRVSIEDRTKISFIRPVFWVEEELINAFRINGDKLEPVLIIVDRNILIMDIKKGNYLVYYGKIQETELKRFWDKFFLSRKDKIAIKEPDISVPADYLDVFNVHWWEF